MFKLLFSPEGRIGPSEFIKGAVILLALNFVLWLAWFVNLPLAMLAGIISLITIYCWVCLFTKRFHDADRTGWLFLAVFAAFMILSFLIVPMIVSLIIPPDPELMTKADELKQMQQDMAGSSDPEDLQMLLASMFELYQSIAMRNAIVYFLSGALLAFGVNSLLKTDPEPNRWG